MSVEGHLVVDSHLKTALAGICTLVCGLRRSVQLEGSPQSLCHTRQLESAEKSKVFRAHAAPQVMCDNLINALKQPSQDRGTVLARETSVQNNGRAQKVHHGTQPRGGESW